jgi:hypothetical protein
MKRAVAITLAMLAMSASPRHAGAQAANLTDLWKQGKPAFGVYAPNENPGPRGQAPRPAVYTREGAERLAGQPAL